MKAIFLKLKFAFLITVCICSLHVRLLSVIYIKSSISSLWSTVSKAALRSKRIKMAHLPLSIYSNRSLTILHKAVSVELNSLYADWSSGSTFSASMWAISCFFAAVSIVFPKKDKLDIGLYDSTFCWFLPLFNVGFTLASFSVFGNDPFSKLRFVILWKTPVSLSILRCSFMSPIGKGSLSQCDFFCLT